MSIVIKSGNSVDTAAVTSAGELKVSVNNSALTVNPITVNALKGPSGNTVDVTAIGELKVALSSSPLTINPVVVNALKGVSGNTADVTALGELKVALSATDAFGAAQVVLDPTIAFTDIFDGGTFDTVNRWNTYGSVAAAQAQGSVSLNPASTANATVAVASQPIIPINTSIALGGMITFEATPVATGTHRFWGLGTAPANVGTYAAPLTDAVGFEVDGGGTLRASVYNTGTRVFTTVLTMPADGLPHLYFMQARGNVVFFYIDDIENAVATCFTAEVTQMLPFRMHRLNSATVTGTGVFTVSGMSVLDISRLSTQLSDGTYPWRKSRIDAAGALSVTSQSGSVTGNGPATVASAAADTLLLAANANRRGATVANDSTSVLYLSLGTNAASNTAYTVKLNAAGYYEVPFGYTGALRGIWASANGAARITEVVAP